MKSNNDEQMNQNNVNFFLSALFGHEGMHPADAGDPFKGVFDSTTFDKEWNLLAPENAPPLTRMNGKSYSNETDQWRNRAETYLLPFHSFAAVDELNIRLRRELPAASLDVKWRILYFDPQAGGAAVYAADLLVLKRKIYEQGDKLKNSVEIDLEAELPPFVDSYEEIKEFKELFGLSMTLSAKLDINRRKNTTANRQTAAKEEAATAANAVGDSSDETRTMKMTSGFRRCNEYSAQSQQSKSGDWHSLMRVELGEYWLDWSEAARRAEFDFDYLASLDPAPFAPIELRFYELVQLLRLRNGDKPLSALKKAPLVIKYGEFTKLMPLPRFETRDQVENQINEMCRAHLERGYLENIVVKPIERKGAFADADLEMVFIK